MSTKNSQSVNTMTFFLVGAGIGAVTALLFAPKAGKELRSDIADATKRSLDQAREKGQEVSEKAGEIYQSGVDRVYDAAERAKESVNDLKDRGRNMLQKQANQISTAIEAGKEGYYEAKRADQAGKA